MLVYSPESPCEKENRAPRGITNRFSGKRNVHNILRPSIAPTDPSRIIDAPLTSIRGSSLVMPSLEKDLLPAPKSLDFAVEGLDYGEFCRLNSMLASRHAWIISSPNSDTKSCSVSSLPHLNASGVSVDSPDVTSKFYAKSPPLRNYPRDNDSPEVEASSFLNDTISIRAIGLSGPKMVGQRRISLTDPSEHPPLSKVPSPQLGIYRGNQSGHFIHTTGIESLPIVIGNSVALDSPDLLSKHTSDCNNNNNSSSGSSSSSGIVSTCQRPSRLRGKTVLLKHLEIDERFHHRSSPSAMNIDGEGSRNENTKSILSSSKSDYDGSARRLSSVESEKENGRSPPLPLRNFERRSVTEEHRSRVRLYEGDGVDKKAAAKTFSTLRSQSLEHLSNESSSVAVDSIGSVFRGKLSLSPTASELLERKEVDNRGLTNIMSRLKCDINPPPNAFGMDANVFRRTSSDTIISSNSEVKDSKLTDYSVEKKNSKEKENKPHDSLLYRKRIMKPSPPLTHPPKPKDYVASKMDLLHSQSSTPVGDSSLHSAAVSFIENSAPVTPFVKNGRTYRSASLPTDEPQSVSPGIGRPRTTSHQYESKIAHRERDRERKENSSIVPENLVHVRNIAKMNGSVVRPKEQYDAGQKLRYPSSSITSSSATATASASVSSDHVGHLSVLRRSAHYRRNNTVTSNSGDRGDVCDLSRYSTGCENHTPSEDDFGITIRAPADMHNYNSNDNNSSNSSYHCNDDDNDNDSSFNGNSYVPRRVRISTAAVSKTYSRTKNPRKKKRGLSYYIIRGASLDVIPEHRELIEFSEYVQIKSKRFSNSSVSDTLKQQLKGR